MLPSRALPLSLRRETCRGSLCSPCESSHSPPLSAAKSPTFLSSSISSATYSAIPALMADGVLIKSSRNRTVSKQCGTCQLRNCWALLQPPCSGEESARGGENFKSIKRGGEKKKCKRRRGKTEASRVCRKRTGKSGKGKKRREIEGKNEKEAAHT